MPDPDPIRDFIAANRGTYTRETLRAQLLAAGHDAAAVDAALAEAAATRPGQASEADRRTFRRWAFGLHLGAVVALVVLVVVQKGTGAFGMAMLGAGVLAIPLLIGWSISFQVGRALLPGTGPMVALVVPLASALLLSGSCFAILNASISAPPRDATVQLTIDPPRSFDGSGGAACYLTDTGVNLITHDLGRLDGRTVSASAFWYGGSVDLSVQVGVDGVDEGTTYFSAISTTRLDAEVSADSRTGTIRFEGLAGGVPASSDPGAGPELISGALSWQCE